MSEGAGTARTILTQARALVDPLYRHALAELPEDLERLLGYHAGWWGADGEPAKPNGKAFSAAMALTAAQAVGGDGQDAVRAAVAVEMVHDASLLHDDIVDGDRTRRHRPAAWTVFGAGPVLFAGVALITVATDLLAPEDAKQLSRTVREIYEGQLQDAAFETRSDVTTGEYLTMVEKKTAVLLATACELGARAAGAPSAQVTLLGSFGRAAGIAYQIADDILGIWGEPKVTGKPVCTDLVAKKKTAPVIAALSSPTKAGDVLRSLYAGSGRLSERQAQEAARLIEDSGARAWAEEEADRWTSLARQTLEQARPADPAGLQVLMNAAVRRTR
ncbi:polyprenyl synthetase family protein [Streptomyces sp. WAC06614]|uniref:polyprenyl synthetase family protein n=1 Tax=Streptomyces sp. WAC06614 TaxID=2487416 RepID=UPI000F7A0914|nr:polyprenyl synthetase family protein [Streptomyces sp. WAC06614]RSS76842.1 polyprenyl synthetase family protein [Streptomyces sp. WAC06614]